LDLADTATEEEKQESQPKLPLPKLLEFLAENKHKGEKWIFCKLGIFLDLVGKDQCGFNICRVHEKRVLR
jgi:hypothetical protein